MKATCADPLILLKFKLLCSKVSEIYGINCGGQHDYKKNYSYLCSIYLNSIFRSLLSCFLFEMVPQGDIPGVKM